MHEKHVILDEQKHIEGREIHKRKQVEAKIWRFKKQQNQQPHKKETWVSPIFVILCTNK